MEDHAAAILAQLLRIADALEKMSGIDKNRRWSPQEYRFIAAGEIDSAREVREELADRKARIKGMETE